jgi:hypothetical protein
MNDDDRVATLEDHRKEGLRCGQKAAGLLLELCFSGKADAMSIETWWKVHEEIIVPQKAKELSAGGSSVEEVDVFVSALTSELDSCCLKHVQLGLMGVSPEVFGVTSKQTFEPISLNEIDPSSTLEDCFNIGLLHSRQEVIISAMRAQYRGYDFVEQELLHQIRERVSALYSLGLNEYQVAQYVSSAQQVAEKYFAEVAHRAEAVNSFPK